MRIWAQGLEPLNTNSCDWERFEATAIVFLVLSYTFFFWKVYIDLNKVLGQFQGTPSAPLPVCDGKWANMTVNNNLTEVQRFMSANTCYNLRSTCCSINTFMDVNIDSIACGGPRRRCRLVDRSGVVKKPLLSSHGRTYRYEPFSLFSSLLQRYVYGQRKR